MVGRTLSHYRVVERLGAGGMGEVYRAHDEKLDRDVALKVLPEGALADETARSRFRREAHALSRLSHPHVATILDFDSEDRTDFLVLELVTGPSLEELLRAGPLPEKDVVRLGSQLARGLQAAHNQGVVHRDLKPSNLALTPDGLLKILDFGLARLLEPKPGGAAADTATETAAGAVVGSPPYMAPEQLLGKPPDPRTDLYAGGAVLYEMATGRRPHGTRTGVALTDAILHEPPPPPRSLDPTLSPGLEAVILKALDKDPELRHQTAKDLLVDLERLQVASSGTSAARSPTTRRPSTVRRPRRLGALAAAATLLVAASAGLWLWPSSRPPRITNARPLTGGMDGLYTGAGWATDGARLYFVAQRGAGGAVYQAPLTGGEPAPLPVTLPVPYQAILGYLPRESALLIVGSETPTLPDNQKGFGLWSLPVSAGAPSRLGNLEAVAAAATPDGEMVALAQRESRLVLVGRDGTPIREWPALPPSPEHLGWSPDARRLRFTAPGPDQHRSWLWEVSRDGGDPRPLWPGRTGGWTPDGRHYVFTRTDKAEARDDIYAVRERGLLRSRPSEPVRLTFGPLSYADVGPSPDGKLLIAWGTAARGELLRFDAKSGRFEKYLGGASVCYVDASRDGEWLTWVSYPDGALWRGRPDGSERLNLTGPGWEVHLPRWSPDGNRILFAARRSTERLLSIYVTARDGGQAELLARSEGELGLWNPCWLPDGRTILYSHTGHLTPHDLGIFRLDLTTRAVALLPGTERLQYPHCSPRGDILAIEKPPEGPPAWSVSFAERDRWERLGPADIGYPAWSPDGQSFTGLDAATRRVERWSRATGRFETVADASDIPLLTWIAVPWMGLAPDGSPLLVRDRSTRDLYALDWEAP